MNNLPADKNRRVLVIDDNRAIHDDFQKILCPANATAAALDATETALFGNPTESLPQTQFEIDSAYQGQEGLLMAAKALECGRPYAMAFVDVRMPPGWDGVETTGKLWELDRNLQVVLCTAYSDYSWAEMFEELGQRDGLLILKKPFDGVEAFQLAHALTEKWWLHQQSWRKMEELESRVAERTGELANSLSLLKATFDSTADGIVVVNLAGKIVSYNTKFTDIWQLPAGILARRDAAEVRDFAAEQVKDSIQFLRRTKELQADPEAEGFDVIELKDGRTFERYVFPQRIDGQCVGTVINWRDITERQRSEEALRESNERFSGAFAHAPIGMALVSPDGHWLQVNQVLCELVGYSEAELLTRTFQDITHPDDLAADLKNLHRLIAGESRSYQMEKRYIHKHGHHVTVLLDVSLVRDGQGQPRYFISQIQDITARKQAEEVLRQRVKLQDQLAHIAATVPGMIYSLRLRPDGSTQMPFASGVLSDIFDLQPKDVIEDAASLFSLIHPDDIGHVQATIAESARTLTPWRDEFRVCRMRLGEIWVEGHSMPQREPDGSILWHGFVQNITERKRAEDALRTSAAEFRGLAEAMPQMVWVTRTDGWCIYFSQQWMDYTGLTLEENLGHGWNKPFHPEDQQRAWDAWQHATATIGIYSIEARLRRADGTYRWWLVRGVPQRDASGNILKWFGTCTDIHDLKQAGDALRESKRFLQSTLDALSSHIAILDEHGTIVEVNASWNRFAAENDFQGASRDVGDNYLKVCDSASGSFSEEAAAVASGIRAIIIGQSDEFHLEYPCHGAREERWFIVRVTRFGGEGPVQVVVAHENITARKRLEVQLFQSQKMETVGKLSGGIAHEFNSILTAIIGQSELLLADLPPESPLIENATEISKAAGRAATLTRQLLAYGRKQFLQPEILDLNAVLAGMESTLRHLLGGDVDVRFVPAAGLHAIKADTGQLEQVIMNLAMNARDAMPNGGKLTLETANVSFDAETVAHYPELQAGDYVMLAITDTGTGMSEEVKRRAFDPFFSTKGVGQGTGLGLSTCYGIIKQSSGHISVYSEPGRGTTFKIYLPQVASPPKIPIQRLDSPDLPRGMEAILLVEDDPALRDMAATLLRRLGYTVFAAADGVEALSLKHERSTGHIDLLFTDVVMPHMSGKELADRVRAMDPHTRILFTSAYTEQAIVHQGVLNHGGALLQKPFSPSALAHKLREVLDSPGAPA